MDHFCETVQHFWTPTKRCMRLNTVHPNEQTLSLHKIIFYTISKYSVPKNVIA